MPWRAAPQIRPLRSQVEEEKTRMRELEDLKRHLDGETEDLQNQVQVLHRRKNLNLSFRPWTGVKLVVTGGLIMLS